VYHNNFRSDDIITVYFEFMAYSAKQFGPWTSKRQRQLIAFSAVTPGHLPRDPLYEVYVSAKSKLVTRLAELSVQEITYTHLQPLPGQRMRVRVRLDWLDAKLNILQKGIEGNADQREISQAVCILLTWDKETCSDEDKLQVTVTRLFGRAA